MGKYKNGIQGPFSGKIGGVIGSKWRGIDYMKIVSGPYAKPATQAQLDQRLKFALVSGWLRPLKDLICLGYQFFTGTKTPMNAAISYHLKEAVVQEASGYVIDFSKAVFSRGELLVSFVKELILLLDGLLQIKWEDQAASMFCKATDKATFIVYNPEKKQFVTFQDVAERGNKAVALQLPKAFANDQVHVWMGYVNVAGDNVSTGVYLGEVGV